MAKSENKPMIILVVVNLVALAVVLWLQWMVMHEDPVQQALPGHDAPVAAAAFEQAPAAPVNTGTDAQPMASDDEYDVRDHAALAELGGWKTMNGDARSAAHKAASSIDRGADTEVTPVMPAQADAAQQSSAPAADELSDRERAYLALLNKAAAENASEIRLIRVKRGDTLWKISRRVYGSGFRHKQILKANPHLKSPNDISVGEFLRVPL